MAVLAECPRCHAKQSAKNKACACGQDLDKAKRSQRVRYWIHYRLPGGKQRKEAVGFSIEEARDAEGKRRGQKRENRIFEMLPEAKMTFSELAGWYLNLNSVKSLHTYPRVEIHFENFNKVFGDRVVSTIKPRDLEDYQQGRAGQGKAPATIDMEIATVKTMITKAFDNDMVDGRTVKAFRRIKKRLKRGSNARDRELSLEEYLKLTEKSPAHLRALLVTAFHTGMRRGELLNLRWSNVDREKGFIRLQARETKEDKPRSIPLNRHVKAVLDTLPRAIHHDYVFTYKGEPIAYSLRRSLKTACKNVGITYGQKVVGGFRFHDVRATFDTNLERAGISEIRRKALVGHSLSGMDKHYIRLKDDDLRQAIDQYTAWIDAQTINVTQTVPQEATRG